MAGPPRSRDPVAVGIGAPGAPFSRSRIRLQGSPVPAQTLGAGQARASVLRSTPERTPAPLPSHSPSPRFPGLGHTNTLLTSRRPRHPVWGGPTAPSPGQPCVLLLRGGWESQPRPEGIHGPPRQGHSLGRKQGVLRQELAGPLWLPALLPQEWLVTGEPKHTRAPQHSSGCWGRALETRPGGRPSCPGRSCPLYPSLPRQVGQPTPPGQSPVGRGPWWLCHAGACSHPPDKGGPHGGARTPFLGSASQPGATAP